MKKLFILIITLCAGVLAPVFADTMNYTIKQEGSEMVIVPYNYSLPIIQKPIYKIEVQPSKIPFYSGKKLPKVKNKMCFV